MGDAATASAEEYFNMTSSNITMDDLYFSLPHRLVGTVILAIILIVGVLGNVMVVAVVRSTRSMHSPTNCYLVSLAVADLVVLLATVPNEIQTYHTPIGVWYTGELGCLIFVLSYQVGVNASALSLIAFTVERYVAICHPMRQHYICTVRRALRIIAAVWVFTVLYCTPWMFLASVKKWGEENVTIINSTIADDAVTCTFAYRRGSFKYLAYYMMDFLLLYLIPLATSCYLYIRIAAVLFPSSHCSEKGVIHLEIQNGTNARYQVVKMLAVVVIVFAVLWLPYRGLMVYNSLQYFGTDPFIDNWYLMFAKSCIYINSAINPILYNAMSHKFRRAFQRVLRCRPRKKKAAASSGNTYSLKRMRSFSSTITSAKSTKG